MYQTQEYLLMPTYEDSACRTIGVLQQLQTLLSKDATLADASQVIQHFQQEFGLQEQLESVIQTLIGRLLEKQVSRRIKIHDASIMDFDATESDRF